MSVQRFHRSRRVLADPRTMPFLRSKALLLVMKIRLLSCLKVAPKINAKICYDQTKRSVSTTSSLLKLLVEAPSVRFTLLRETGRKLTMQWRNWRKKQWQREIYSLRLRLREISWRRLTVLSLWNYTMLSRLLPSYTLWWISWMEANYFITCVKTRSSVNVEPASMQLNSWKRSDAYIQTVLSIEIWSQKTFY